MYLGFEGGHGTVAGLKNDFPDMQHWTDGFDVGIGMATTGLLGATIWGVMLINIATRKKWLASTGGGAKGSSTDAHVAGAEGEGTEDEDDLGSSGGGRVPAGPPSDPMLCGEEELQVNPCVGTELVVSVDRMHVSREGARG